MVKDDDRYLILRNEAEVMDNYLPPTDEEDKSLEYLCDRAKQALLSSFIINHSCFRQNFLFFSENCSPIEQIFYIAYVALASNRKRLIKWYSKSENKEYKDMSMDILLLNIFHQHEVLVGKKKYVVDFMVDFEPTSMNTGVKYAAELDGYDYHSSKKQMNYDYERERALQKAGYKVVRFTGSQVYKSPFSCARELIELIIDDSTEFIEFSDKD